MLAGAPPTPSKACPGRCLFHGAQGPQAHRELAPAPRRPRTASQMSRGLSEPGRSLL